MGKRNTTCAPSTGRSFWSTTWTTSGAITLRSRSFISPLPASTQNLQALLDRQLRHGCPAQALVSGGCVGGVLVCGATAGACGGSGSLFGCLNLRNHKEYRQSLR